MDSAEVVLSKQRYLLRGYHLLRIGRSWESWGLYRLLFFSISSSQKWWRDCLVVTIFKIFFQWNNPKNAFFPRYAHSYRVTYHELPVTLQLGGGGIQCWLSNRGIRKNIVQGNCRNSCPPPFFFLFKENGGLVIIIFTVFTVFWYIKFQDIITISLIKLQHHTYLQFCRRSFDGHRPSSSATSVVMLTSALMA